VLLGLLLGLPIPFTNMLFGALLLVYALALLERDGALMVLAWIAGIITIWTFAAVSIGFAMTLIERIPAWH
jgi:hypothetical protein